MIRLSMAALVFAGIRIGLTVALGWLAIDWLEPHFEHIADQLALVTARL